MHSKLLFILIPVLCLRVIYSGYCRYKLTDWCRPYNSAWWIGQKHCMNCQDGKTYHCAKDYDNHSKYVEGCAYEEFCLIGEEPRLSFVKNGEPQTEPDVYCKTCSDENRFNSHKNQSSAHYSECQSIKHNICTDAEHKILCKVDDSTSERFCRCDARRGYVPSYVKDGPMCSHENYECSERSCEALSNGSQQLMLDYSCAPFCQKGFNRSSETDDNCLPIPTVFTTEPPTSPIPAHSATTADSIANYTTMSKPANINEKLVCVPECENDNVCVNGSCVLKPLKGKDQMNWTEIILIGVLVLLLIVIATYLIYPTCRNRWNTHRGRNRLDTHRVLYNAVQNPPGSDVENPPGSAVENPSGSDVENPSGSDVENPSRSAVQNPPGSDVENPSCSAVQNPSGSSVQNPSGSAVQNIHNEHKTIIVRGDYHVYKGKNIHMNAGDGTGMVKNDESTSEDSDSVSVLEDNVAVSNSTDTYTEVKVPTAKPNKNNKADLSDGIDLVKDVEADADCAEPRTRDFNVAVQETYQNVSKDRIQRTRKYSTSLNCVFHMPDIIDVNDLKDVDRYKLIKIVMDRCLLYFLENLVPSTMLDQFTKREMLTHIKRRDIQDGKTQSEQIRLIVKEVRAGSIQLYHNFKLCMVDSKQEACLKETESKQKEAYEEQKNLKGISQSQNTAQVDKFEIIEPDKNDESISEESNSVLEDNVTDSNSTDTYTVEPLLTVTSGERSPPEELARIYLSSLTATNNFETFTATAQSIQGDINKKYPDLLHITECPNRPPLSPKEYSDCPTGFQARYSSGNNKCCLYQSVSLLLFGTEQWQHRLRLMATLNCCQLFKQYMKQFQIHLQQTQIDTVKQYFYGHIDEVTWKRINSMINLEEILEECLPALIRETSCVGRDSSRLHVSFLSEALGMHIRQFFQIVEHYGTSLDEVPCIPHTESRPVLHIFWVDISGKKKQMNHIVPLEMIDEDTACHESELLLGSQT